MALAGLEFIDHGCPWTQRPSGLHLLSAESQVRSHHQTWSCTLPYFDILLFLPFSPILLFFLKKMFSTCLLLCVMCRVMWCVWLNTDIQRPENNFQLVLSFHHGTWTHIRLGQQTLLSRALLAARSVFCGLSVFSYSVRPWLGTILHLS